MKRSLSIQERKRRGLVAQGRARQTLGQITDPGIRRAIDALTSLDNWDEEVFTFTDEGRLTLDRQALREIIGDRKPTMTVQTQTPKSEAKNDPALSFDGETARFTQLPARGDLDVSISYPDLVARVNEILADQRNAGHRARGTNVASADGTGFQPLNVVSVSTTYTATLQDDVILCDGTSGGFTVNAPAVATCPGKSYWLKKIDAASTNITFDPSGSEQVEGASTHVNGMQNDCYHYVNDGTAWYIIAWYG